MRRDMPREERALQRVDDTGDGVIPAPVRKRRRARRREQDTLAQQYLQETRRKRATAFLLIGATFTACLLFLFRPGPSPVPQVVRTPGARPQQDLLQQPGVREAVMRALQGRTGNLPSSGGAVIHDGTTGQKLELKTPKAD